MICVDIDIAKDIDEVRFYIMQKQICTICFMVLA